MGVVTWSVHLRWPHGPETMTYLMSFGVGDKAVKKRNGVIAISTDTVRRPLVDAVVSGEEYDL